MAAVCFLRCVLVRKCSPVSGFLRLSSDVPTTVDETATRSKKTEADDVDVPLSGNDHVSPFFENRNPRNLENMCLARKPKGWALDYPTRQYWNKVHLEQSSRHTTAHVRHFTGKNIVTASTTEWAIQKFLYSNTDVSAAENIGRVLARRCLESGILHVHAHFTQEEEKSEKVKLFRQALEEGGLLLEEPRRIYPLRPWD